LDKVVFANPVSWKNQTLNGNKIFLTFSCLKYEVVFKLNWINKNSLICVELIGEESVYHIQRSKETQQSRAERGERALVARQTV
jgi:hypothetical protein